jgi:methyl acetate hydrolase
MWAGITNCYYWIDPANGIGGALMTQILPFADPVALPLFMQFEAELYKSLR